MSIIFLFLGHTFAITQTVNETNWINYGYIKNVYKKWATYFLSVDYIQIYQWYEAALARAEDGVILGSLSIKFNQSYPTSYYTTNSNGEIFATKTIRKKITAYLVKVGENGVGKILNKIDSYTWSDPWHGFNDLSEIERMIAWPFYDPAAGWSANYIRNTNTQIRNIPFSSTAKITVEGNTMTLPELVTWAQSPTQFLVKVFLKKGKIEWFRVEFHP